MKYLIIAVIVGFIFGLLVRRSRDNKIPVGILHVIRSTDSPDDIYLELNEKIPFEKLSYVTFYVHTHKN